MKLLAFLITIITAFYLQAAELVWNSKDNFKDWKRFRFCSKKIENGILKLYDIAFDPCIVNDSINCNPKDFNAISITYRAKDITLPSTGEIFFAHGAEKFSQSRFWAIPSLKSDGNWHTLIIKPKNLKSWLTGGNINSLRIDMVNKPGGTIEIKEIKLHKIDNTTTNSNATNNVNSNNIWSKDKLKLWKYFHNCNGKVVNNILSVNITKSDSKIFTNNLSINPKNANVFVIVYRAKNIKATSGELYFARDKENFSDARKWRIPALISDNTWHTLKIDDKYLNNHNSWYNKGVVTKLRLDPTNAAGGTIEIKEIRFEKKNSIKVLPKITVKMDEPLWPSVKSQLKKENTTAPYFNAKMIRAPQDTLKGKMMRPFYVRKKFTLKDKPTHAKLQFTADDYSQVVINGKEVAFSNSWRETVNADVVQYLKKGDNVIGFQYYNKDTWGGVFGELYLQFKDNSSLRINTNKSFKSSDKAFPNWATVSFDDSKWDNVIEQLGPPNKPWVVKLGYTFYKDLQKLTFAKVNKSSFTWGEKLSLNFTCQGTKPVKDFAFRLVLKNKETTQWAEGITIPVKNITSLNNQSWQSKFSINLPYYIPTGNYEIKLDSPQFSVQSNLKKNLAIKIAPAPLKNSKFAIVPKFQVVNKNNLPYFELNGKPFYLSLAKCHSYFGDQTSNISTNAPFSAVNPSPNYEKWHPKVDIYDFSEFDRVAAKVVKSHPNAYIIWGLDLYIPPNFHHKYPDDMLCDVTGLKYGGYRHSVFSKIAGEYLAKTAVKAIEYVEKSPYANRVIGYRIGGGYTTEFLGWEPGRKMDFSLSAKKYFTNFAKRNYPALKDYTIPTYKERTNIPAGTLLWNPAKHLNVTAYFDSYSTANAQIVGTICSQAKAYLKKHNLKKVIGTYFGYVATLNHNGLAQMRGHYALNTLLKTNSVDFIMSPNSYPLRNLGDIVGDMKPFATLRNHNIISIIEDDTRTHNTVNVMSTPGSRSQVVTQYQSINVMRRNIGVALCRNQPENYNPMFNSTFDFKAMAKDIATRRILGDYCTAKKITRNAQVAIVVSEKAIVSMPVLLNSAPSGYIQQLYNADGTVERKQVNRNIPNYEMYVGNQGRFARTGAPFDIVLAEALDKAQDYKVYAFINAFNYDKKFLDTVKKLQQKKCTILWVYAPGFAYNNNASLQAMKNLTGLSFNQVATHLMPAVKLANNTYMGTPTTRVKPIFSVIDKNVKVLGRYEDNSIGLACKKVGNSLTYFSGPWQLDISFLASIFKEAGIHLYSNSCDPLEANDSIVMLHARTPGKKVITLPVKCDILDVYSNKIVARNVNKFEYNAKLHQTNVFYYGKDVDILQKKLSKVANF